MTTNKPRDARSLADLVAAAHDDEQLQLCDELARGDKTAAEVDAALAQLGPRLRLRIERLRQMSSPLDTGQKNQLVALLLQPAPAKQTALSVMSGGVGTTKAPLRRSRTTLYAAGLALAASAAVYVAWPRDNEPLPELALEVVEHNPAVLSAPVPAGPGRMQVHAGNCLELRLRPMQSYGVELQTLLWLVAEDTSAPRQPVPWPVTMHQTDKGLLQLDTCEKLPAVVGPGNWQLAVVYGRKLPPSDTIAQALTAPAGRLAPTTWQVMRQPLQVLAASP